jgi:hypothetical protein
MADSPNKLAGIASLNIDGINYLVAGDLKYQVSGVTRETLVGQDSVHGYSEKPRQGKISMSLRDWGGLSMADVQAMSDVTIVAELANGKTIVGRNMWNVEDQEVDTTEAKADIVFEGKSVVEA